MQHSILASLLLLPFALASPIPDGDPSPTTCINTPTPTPSKCGDKVKTFTGWTLSNFYYHASYTFTTPAHQNSWGYVDFNISSALGHTYACNSASSQLSDFYYGTVEYACQLTGGENAQAWFKFNRANGLVDIKEQWVCYDEPQYPATYTATGNGTAAQTCTDTGYVVNPDWQLGTGQIYSQRNIECQKETVAVKVQQITAVA